MSHADPSPVSELIQAFRCSQTMFTAVSFGVFDLVEPGGQRADMLAWKPQTHLRSMLRLLEGCVGIGLLKKSDELYLNTPIPHDSSRWRTAALERHLTLFSQSGKNRRRC